MVDELFTAILKRAEGLTDACFLLLAVCGISLWVNLTQWRRADATRRALQEAQEAHMADLRHQIAISEERMQILERYAEGFQAGAHRLEPYKNNSPPST